MNLEMEVKITNVGRMPLFFDFSSDDKCELNLKGKKIPLQLLDYRMGSINDEMVHELTLRH